MSNQLVHERESSQDTEQHLHENEDKFQSDCVFLLKKMYAGEILTRKSVLKLYDMNERRLGNLHEAGKCEKRWAMKPNGKRSHVEYFVTIPKPPTKKDLIKWYDEANQGGKLIQMDFKF